MGYRIDEELIEHIGILAKLDLSEEEKKKAKADMERMLDYIDCLNEVDTDGIEPLSSGFPACNAFREDTVVRTGDSGRILANAPQQKERMFAVPTTILPAEGG